MDFFHSYLLLEIYASLLRHLLSYRKTCKKNFMENGNEVIYLNVIHNLMMVIPENGLVSSNICSHLVMEVSYACSVKEK